MNKTPVFIFRFLIRQKLFIGLLWLFLRGSCADGQNLYGRGFVTCYIRPHRDKIFSHLDLSADFQVSNQQEKQLIPGLEIGRNCRYITPGLSVNYFTPENSMFTGPYLRVFSPDIPLDTLSVHACRYRMNVFVECKYEFAVNSTSNNHGYFLSAGLIFFRLEHFHSYGKFGFELYESYSNISGNSGEHFFSTGIRVHYYITR